MFCLKHLRLSSGLAHRPPLLYHISTFFLAAFLQASWCPSVLRQHVWRWQQWHSPLSKPLVNQHETICIWYACHVAPGGLASHSVTSHSCSHIMLLWYRPRRNLAASRSLCHQCRVDFKGPTWQTHSSVLNAVWKCNNNMPVRYKSL